MSAPAILKSMLQIVGTAGIIAGVAVAIVTLSPAPDEPAVEVRSSQADIFWMTPIKPTNTQKFASALHELGHEPPRNYQLNGNEVFFSSRVSTKTPEMLIQEYQHAFVANKLNSRAWTNTPDRAIEAYRNGEGGDGTGALDVRAQAAMNGEVMPEVITADQVVMTGMVIDTGDVDVFSDQFARAVEHAEKGAELLNRAYERCGADPRVLQRVKTQQSQTNAEPDGDVQRVRQALEKSAACNTEQNACSELSERLRVASLETNALDAALEAQPNLRDCSEMAPYTEHILSGMDASLTEKIRGFRSIEATRDRDTGYTLVTASWSDEKFDMKSVFPDDYAANPPTPSKDDLPGCPGCARELDFKGTAAESAYATTTMSSTASPAEVAANYIDVLKNDGWQLQPNDPQMEQDFRDDHPEKTDQQILRFSREDRHLTLQIHRDREHARTLINATTAN